MTTTEAPELRVDAQNNRNRILDVARDTFAARGLDAPMAAIARRAGVGVATLYRRFPTKESLIAEAFADKIEQCTSVIDDGLADPDPWHGFCMVVEQVCAMQAVDRGLTAALVTTFPDVSAFDAMRLKAERGFEVLAQRAKDAGRLRQDFEFDDLTMVLMANGGLITTSTEAALAASRRLVAFLLQSFRADRAEPLPPSTPLGLDNVIPRPQ